MAGIGIGKDRHGLIPADILHKLAQLRYKKYLFYLSQMNRLILIGNGFDLAHGLKTSYKDFIYWYVHKCVEKAFNDFEHGHEDKLVKIKSTNYHLTDALARFKWVENFIANYAQVASKGSFGWPEQRDDVQHYVIDDISDLLDRLLKSASINKWVDIEGIFYEQLIAILDNKEKVLAKESDLQKLNEAMRSIINELQIYLSTIKAPDKINGYDDIIYSRIDVKDIQSKPIKFRTAYNRPFETSMPKETLILNFNYTDTITTYTKLKLKPPSTIFIHGKLNDPDNPIIFGFGDEVDKRYTDIENSPAHGWFEYIKSFWYLKTNNYRDLTSFIDSDEYQVVVLGHSCGLSDRTMLQMIFQHDNCRSIKLYYYGDKDVNNHTQTLHEVARHFKDKGLMRRRIVSEENSQRMPQYSD